MYNIYIHLYIPKVSLYLFTLERVVKKYLYIVYKLNPIYVVYKLNPKLGCFDSGLQGLKGLGFRALLLQVVRNALH